MEVISNPVIPDVVVVSGGDMTGPAVGHCRANIFSLSYSMGSGPLAPLGGCPSLALCRRHFHFD